MKSLSENLFGLFLLCLFIEFSLISADGSLIPSTLPLDNGILVLSTSGLQGPVSGSFVQIYQLASAFSEISCDPDVINGTFLPLCFNAIQCNVTNSTSGIQESFQLIVDITCNDGINCTLDKYQCPSSTTNGSCVSIELKQNCDDGNPCTNDICSTSGCEHIPLECDDRISCTTDQCIPLTNTTYQCTHTSLSCDDNIECTNDFCDLQFGTCRNILNDQVCSNSLDLCSIGYCNPYSSLANSSTGCVVSSKYCDDQIACTVDSCDPGSGICTFTPQNSFCNDGISCTDDLCDVALGKCLNQPNSSLCYSNNSCEVGICSVQDGACTFVALSCDDQIECTIDLCEGGICLHYANDSLCNDQIQCTQDICSVKLGKCLNIPCDDLCSCNSSICDPYSSNSQSDGCVLPLNGGCDDEVACTTDLCDIATGNCIHIPNNSSCDDGIECTIDICQPNVGKCVNIPDDKRCCATRDCRFQKCHPFLGCQPLNVSFCDDGIDCTEDFCQNESCGHASLDSRCNDNNMCTFDFCNVTRGGCVHIFSNSACDDGISCTEDTCDSLNQICIHTPINARCDDGISCSNDVCDVTKGCLYFGSNALCDDNVSCTQDLCDLRDGCLNIPRDYSCQDGIECTSSICDIVAGCLTTYNNQSCVDQFSCTEDTCNPNNPGADPITGCIHLEHNEFCNDNIGCTIDYCSQYSGCSHIPDNSLCDDGTLCSTFSCNPLVGCQVDCINCGVEEKRLCINCNGGRGRVENTILSTGQGNLEFKTRNESTPQGQIPSNKQGLFLNWNLRGSGQTIVSKNNPNFFLAKDDGLIASTVRILPSNEMDLINFPCNEVTRGQLLLIPIQQNGQTIDTFYICFQTLSGFIWKPFS